MFGGVTGLFGGVTGLYGGATGLFGGATTLFGGATGLFGCKNRGYDSTYLLPPTRKLERGLGPWGRKGDIIGRKHSYYM